MLKYLTVLVCLSVTITAFATNPGKQKGKKKTPFEPSVFEVIPLNSPVKGSTANFLLKTPTGFVVDKVKYRIKNASKLFEKDTPHQNINLVDGPQGRELQVPIGKVPPGFYRLYVLVVDKNNKEQQFKSAYHDFVRFVVDESLQVPMPDPKINDATIGGVDSDNDGIRDDVQRFINETYSSSMKTKLAARQYAMMKQAELLTSGNKNQSILITTNSLWSLDCLDAAVDNQDYMPIMKSIKEKYLNTKDRLYSNMRANENFSGQLFEQVDASIAPTKCNFDLSTLPN